MIMGTINPNFAKNHLLTRMKYNFRLNRTLVGWYRFYMILIHRPG